MPRNLENYYDDDGDLIWWESTDEELFMAVVGDTTSNPGISYRGNAELYFSLLRELSDRDLIPELHMELKRMIGHYQLKEMKLKNLQMIGKQN